MKTAVEEHQVIPEFPPTAVPIRATPTQKTAPPLNFSIAKLHVDDANERGGYRCGTADIRQNIPHLRHPS